MYLYRVLMKLYTYPGVINENVMVAVASLPAFSDFPKYFFFRISYFPNFGFKIIKTSIVTSDGDTSQR